ncbi:MAG: amidohydrolase family protein [Chloroflexi bacterium]|nr:amidohydrolase family protein [Chloroflexota bacterium]
MARPPIVDLQAFLTPASTVPVSELAPPQVDFRPPETAITLAGLTRLARATGGMGLEDAPAGLAYLWASVDKAGVDTVALGAAPLTAAPGEPPGGNGNDAALAAVQGDPGRVLAFLEADPRRGAPLLADVEEWCAVPGVVGCMLTSLRWGRLRLDDRHLLYPIYERCQASGRAVLIQGGLGFPAPGAHERPYELVRLALAFPHLRVLVADAASAPPDAVCMVAGALPNVHLVLSGWFGLLVRESPALAWMELERLRVHLGAERLLWGSGWPFAGNQRETVQFLVRGSVPGPLREAGVRGFSEQERRALLGGNAAALFGLPAVEDGAATAGPYSGRLAWTPEAEGLLKQVPGLFRSKARGAVEDYARDQGQRTVTVEIMAEVRRSMLGF